MTKTRDKYVWVAGQTPPPIDPHSLVKHKIVERYLERYVQALMCNPKRENLKISVVDGFAGGGNYSSTEDNCLYKGSPLLAIQAIEEAQAWLNTTTRKPRTIDAQFYFVEKEPSTFEYLTILLKSEGYAQRIGKDIHPHKGSFDKALSPILQHIKNHKGGERAIFLLDQYAYDDVPTHLLKQIFGNLQNAEVLLTFNVDSLITFLSDKKQFVEKLEEMGLLRHVDLKFFSILKETNNPNWKAVIQRMLAKGIMIESGARFSTIFYVTPLGSTPWTYWLIHLSNVYKARDVMMELHWEQANNFSHYLEPDIFTLGYNANLDSLVTKQSSFEDMSDDFSFDKLAAEKCEAGLAEKLAVKLYSYDEPVKVESLLHEIASYTPATKDMICKALSLPIAASDIEVVSEKGTKREKGSSVHVTDTIIPSRQKRIFLGF